MNHEPMVVSDTDKIRRRLQQDAQKNAHKRRFERYETFVLSRLVMMNTSQGIDGVINEISAGGMRFRPASRYLQKQDDEVVSIIVGSASYSGRIRSSRPDGYGIQLLEMLSDDTLRQILGQAAA